MFVVAIPQRQDTADIEYNRLVGSFVRSPRRSQIRDAGERTIATEIFSTPQPDMSPEPYNTLIKAFSSYGDLDQVFFQTISTYMERVTASTGTILWQQGEQSNGLFVIESGVLRAFYTFAKPTQQFEESMVAGTLAGELSALAESPRNATVTVEHGPAILWKLSGANLKKLQTEEPEFARVFIQLVLKGAVMISKHDCYVFLMIGRPQLQNWITISFWPR
jgi:SulP family sulfate permease